AGDAAAGSPGGAPRRAEGLLRAGGWRVVTVRTAAELADVWARAGEDPARAG
ncbi:DUF58 domain-containing protein, partial [Actinomadura sp. WAC 06369]